MSSPSTRVRAGTLVALVTALSAAVMCAGTPGAASTRDVDACRALGFDADVLDCRRCDELSSFLSDKLAVAEGGDRDSKKKKEEARASQALALGADCRQCCADISALDLSNGGAQQYDRVVLEVCTCKFGRYPKVANFVHYHAEKHAKLEVEYINARHPFLIFYDAEGNKKEEIGISSWDEDTISEFIVVKLKPDDEKSADAPDVEADAEPETVDEKADSVADGEPSDETQDGVDEEESQDPQRQESDEL